MNTISNAALRQAHLSHVINQLQRGWKPRWVLSFHYGNPYERGWRVVETSTRWGYSVPRNRMLWDVVGHDKALTAKRNDAIAVSRDACHIRNLMLQHGWGIRGDLRAHDPASTPMLFVHEKGQQRLQYHTHLVIGALPYPHNSAEAIHKLWQQHILPRAKCLSRTNSFHVGAVYSPIGLAGYLSKEIKSPEITVDYLASCLITPKPPDVRELLPSRDTSPRTVASVKAAQELPARAGLRQAPGQRLGPDKAHPRPSFRHELPRDHCSADSLAFSSMPKAMDLCMICMASTETPGPVG